jgi:intracellular septation protein A
MSTEPEHSTQTEPTETLETAKKKPGSGRMFIELIFCIIIPTLILKKLSGDEQLGSNLALIVALSFPLGFGIYEFMESKKVRFVPALGFISILLTGGIGLLQLDVKYIAIKEALIPLTLGIATVLSTYTKYPLIRTFLYNDTVMQVDKVAAKLESDNRTSEFDKMMVRATWLLASSFLLSAVLNYVLAKIIVVSPAGTAEFNDQLGTMNLMSYPVIVVPCMIITLFALFYVIKNIKRLTGFELEEIINQ